MPCIGRREPKQGERKEELSDLPDEGDGADEEDMSLYFPRRPVHRICWIIGTIPVYDVWVDVLIYLFLLLVISRSGASPRYVGFYVGRLFIVNYKLIFGSTVLRVFTPLAFSLSVAGRFGFLGRYRRGFG